MLDIHPLCCNHSCSYTTFCREGGTAMPLRGILNPLQ